MGKFIKSADLRLVNGGYVSDKEENPIYNAEFINAQRKAEYIVKFAELAKDKDFVGKKADSLEDVKNKLAEMLAEDKPVYVEAPKKVEQKLTKKLAAEAMAFMKHTDDVSNVKKINTFMQDFNVLKDFEEHGLFFDEGIVKLNKIYTVSDIVKAVTETIDLLEK